MDWAIIALLSVILIAQILQLIQSRQRALSVEERIDEGTGRVAEELATIRRAAEFHQRVARGRVHELPPDDDEEEELTAFGAFDKLEASVYRDEAVARAMDSERCDHEVGDLHDPGSHSDHLDHQDPSEGQEAKA